MAVRGHRQARSIRALAAAVGKSPSAVRKWVAKDSWCFSLAPPWDIERVRAWAEIHLARDPAAEYRKRARAIERGSGEYSGISLLTKARLQRSIEGTLLIRQRRLIEAGRMHDSDQCAGEVLRLVMAARGKLLELPRSIAAGLAGRDANTIEELLMAQITEICEELGGEKPAGEDAKGIHAQADQTIPAD